MKATHYLWLSTLALGACTKEQPLPACTGACTTIRGRLLTGQPQVGLGGVPVIVKWFKPVGANYNVREKARTTTNADGTYEISFHIADDELGNGFCEAVYQADKNQFYTLGEAVDAFYQVKRDTILTASPYVIPRKAYLTITLTNPGALGSSRGFISEFSSCYGHNTLYNSRIQGGGAVIVWDSRNPVYKLEMAGDQSILVRHYGNRGASNTPSTDSLFIPAGTTRAYDATY